MATLIVKDAAPMKDGSFAVVGSIDGITFDLYVRNDADLEQQALALLNRKDDQGKTVITLGERIINEPAPPPPPTQEQLDLEAWRNLLQTYRQTKAKANFGDGKTTELDVIAAHDALKATYLDSYAPYLVGTF